MPSIAIGPPYRGPTQGVADVQVTGTTVRECLDAVEAIYPGFIAQALDADGNVQRFTKIFVDGDPLGRDEAGRSVGENAEIAVLAAIAGG